jgi:hypothetical protein
VALKTADPGSAAAINTLVASNGMVASTMDRFGTTEVNDGSNDGNVDETALPVYWNIALNGGAVRVCGNRDVGLFNKLGNRRFLRFSLSATVVATIRAQYTPAGSDAPGASTVAPDPDIVLFKGPYLAIAESDANDREDLIRTLDAGDYVIEVYEYSHIEAPASPATSRGRTCYNVSITG